MQLWYTPHLFASSKWSKCLIDVGKTLVHNSSHRAELSGRVSQESKVALFSTQ